MSRALQRLVAVERVPLVAGPAEPTAAAARAHLHYVSVGERGIARLGSPPRFRYVDHHHRPVRDTATLARIRALAIPPAWTEVWISPSARGHIQAYGRDARGRKQYRYHARWREIRDRSKFGRLIDLAHALPRIRGAVEADLQAPGLGRRKVLAALVALLERTCIRIGGDEYARTNRHYGLTTLLDRHVAIHGARLEFRFQGKSGKHHTVGLEDRRLARIARACQEIPGQRLFQYRIDGGRHRTIGSADVNGYLREVSGEDFTAKDFRTWAGTVFVTETLNQALAPATVKAGKEAIVAAIDRAAERLGNTRSVCRASYVHPAVLDAFTEGWLRRPPATHGQRAPAGLDAAERATLRVLEAAAQPRSATRARAA